MIYLGKVLIVIKIWAKVSGNNNIWFNTLYEIKKRKGCGFDSGELSFFKK